MAKIKLELNSEDFDYVVDQLGIEIDVTEKKVLEIITKHFDLEKVLIDHFQRTFLCAVPVSSYVRDEGKTKLILSPDIKKKIGEYLEPYITRAVGNYIRTQNHTCEELIDASVKQHIASGIESGIQQYAELTSKKIAKAINQN